MVSESDVREALCEIGRRSWQKNYVAANDGNFSFRIDENRVLCTPTQISKGFMSPEDLVEVDLKGNQLSGRRRLTSEIRIHLFVYRYRPDVYSVVHVHPPHALAFALTHTELPKCVLPEVEVNLSQVPLVPYVQAGTWEFAESIGPWVTQYDAFLLRNHGALTLGKDPFDAYYKMETLDQYCRILLLAKQLGNLKELDQKQMEDLFQLKEKFGVPDPRKSSPADERCGTGVPPVLPSAKDLKEPSVPFRPHSGPLIDEPKIGQVSGWREAPDRNPRTDAAAADMDQLVDEVMRRLRGK